MTILDDVVAELGASVIAMDGDPLSWPIEERPVCYLAGFYTANPAQGIGNTADWYRHLTDLGWVVWVPHVSFLLDMMCPNTPDFWYSVDLALLARCDAMFVIDDMRTQESTGVRNEIVFAAKRNIPVFFEIVAARDRYAR